MSFLEVRQRTNTAPANICIYCGSTKNLTDEHVVPFALGGNLVIPKASCKSCAKITSLLEGKILRGFMFDARIAGNFPTSHPQNRPSAVSVGIRPKYRLRFKKVDIPSSEAVGVIFLPTFERATFLVGKPPITGIHIMGTEVIGFGKNLKDISTQYKGEAMQFTQSIPAHDFVRFLAKIGYCYAVASIGPYPLNEVPVLDLILGKDDCDGTYVGSADYRIEAEINKPLHALGLNWVSGIYGGEAIKILFSQVKLFAGSGAKGYEVVVRKPA